MIGVDLTTGSIDEALTIFLGDYVDRGPDAATVLERLSCCDFPTPIMPLRGNHEEMLVGFLRDAEALSGWRQYGALETLHSYGVQVADVMRGAGFEAARQEFAAKLPPHHLRFIQNTATHAAIGDYFFCHAGVRPGVQLDQQSEHDLLWIRDEFLEHPSSFGKVVVHGHTPVEAPDFRPNRINIDTGAFATGRLTCLVLEDTTKRVLAR